MRLNEETKPNQSRMKKAASSEFKFISPNTSSSTTPIALLYHYFIINVITISCVGVKADNYPRKEKIEAM